MGGGVPGEPEKVLSGGERSAVSRAKSGAGMCSVSHGDAPPLPETLDSLSKGGGEGWRAAGGRSNLYI